MQAIPSGQDRPILPCQFGATFCVSVTHFKINDFLLYMHFIFIILGNFSFSWVIYIILFFTTVAVIGNLFQAHMLFALVLSKMSKVHGSC